MKQIVILNTDSRMRQKVAAHLLSDYADPIEGDCFVVRSNTPENIEEMLDAVNELLEDSTDSVMRFVSLPDTDA